MPDWVQGYRQKTDAYLSKLAEKHGLKLLAINRGIPDRANGQKRIRQNFSNSVILTHV